VFGDTIGDPLKDTSGASFNILIKLMAVESLVLAPFFVRNSGVLRADNEKLPTENEILVNEILVHCWQPYI
jgi:Inorganic H+ pyrophosphatase